MDFDLKEFFSGLGEVWRTIASEFPLVKWIIIVLVVLLVGIVVFGVLKRRRETKLNIAKNLVSETVETHHVEEKKRWIVALLNLLIPGAGFIYLSKLGRFILALFSTTFLMIIFLPAGVVLWLVWIFVGYFSASPGEVKKAKEEREALRSAEERRKPVDKMTVIIAIIVVIVMIVLACLGILK